MCSVRGVCLHGNAHANMLKSADIVLQGRLRNLNVCLDNTAHCLLGEHQGAGTCASDAIMAVRSLQPF